VAYPAQVTNHVPAAQARLLVEYQQSPNLQGLLAVFAGRTQLVENAIYAVLTQRSLATASGQQLDNIGKVVGLPRSRVAGGNVDALYAKWLQVQILINASAGNAPNLISIILAGGDAGVTAFVTDSGPMSCVARAFGVALSQPTALSGALQQARAAGVHLVMEYLASTQALAFTLDGTSAQALDAGAFAGAI
jgi:hypothetical protein